MEPILYNLDKINCYIESHPFCGDLLYTPIFISQVFTKFSRKYVVNLVDYCIFFPNFPHFDK